MERIIQTLMYRARWVLAPIYLGLSLALIALGIKIFQEVFHLLVIAASICHYLVIIRYIV